MAKFCSVCGTQTDDAALVCGNCGSPFRQNTAPVQAPTQPEYQTPVQAPVQPEPQPQVDYQTQYQYQQPQTPEKKKSKIDVNAIVGTATTKAKETLDGVKKGDKKSIITVAGLAAAILAVLIIVISIFSVAGEEKVAKKVLKAIDKDKSESIVKLLPKFYFNGTEYGFDMDESEWAESYDNRIGYVRETFEDELESRDFKLNWEIVDVDYFGYETLKELADDFEEYNDFKESKLKKGAAVEIELTGKKGGEKYYIEMTVYAYKYGGSWYFYSWDYEESVQN